MGLELECRMSSGGKTLEGKAYLETDFLLFRGDERFKLFFRDLTLVTATDGILRVEFKGGAAEFELGKAAAKWADKILNPPSRAAKLGINPGVKVKLVGEFDPSFLNEVAGAGAEVVNRAAEITFYAASVKVDLARVAELVSKGVLWIVYPKGVSVIREIDVLTAGRAAGLKDIKVASFSPTHTALKFVP